jgi:hypothetical protein
MAYHSDLKGHNTGGAKLLLADIRSGKLGFTLAGGPAYRFKTKCFCSVLPHSKKVKKKVPLDLAKTRSIFSKLPRTCASQMMP